MRDFGHGFWSIFLTKIVQGELRSRPGGGGDFSGQFKDEAQGVPSSRATGVLALFSGVKSESLWQSDQIVTF
jgi:hypothetical protein